MIVRLLSISLLLLAWVGLATGADALTRTFVDDAGRTVEIPETIGSVMAAGPPAAVLLYALAPERMVGRVSAPGEVITAASLRALYGVGVAVAYLDQAGRSVCTPLLDNQRKGERP